MTEPFDWRQLHWQRPIDSDLAAEVIRQWAADQRSPLVALEVRVSGGVAEYFLGADRRSIDHLTRPLRELLGTTATSLQSPRTLVQGAGRLTTNTHHRPLRLNEPEIVIRAVLSALTRTKATECLVVQVLLGPRRIPMAVPTSSPSSAVEPWWKVAWFGNGQQLDGEKRTALRTKVSDHGFAATVRLGAVAAEPDRRRALLLGTLAAVRTVEAPGVRLALKPESVDHLNAARSPWRWPLRLGVHEVLPILAWPLGDGDMPGQSAQHPRLLAPAPGTTGAQRVLATATGSVDGSSLVLPVKDALRHLHVIAPTGAGKSTLLAQLALQDISDGRAVVVIEPRGDLVDDILARVPASQRDRIVVLDPQDPAPVGLNPLALYGRRPELVADNVLTIFKQLYGKAVGPRSQDILYAGLLTLAKHEGASLAMLPLLLTNRGFRRSLVSTVSDPLSLDTFWATYEAWSEAERAAAIAPVMNKLRPMLRPGLRGVIGQRNPKFSLSQVFTERRVLLVPLQRGVIGTDAASLLGSLLVSELWQLIQARGAIPPAQRHPVMVYIDEVQDYLNTGTDLGEALAQARGYGASFTLAHQFLGQLPSEMRAAILSNTRSRVTFAVPPKDAKVLAEGHPEVSPADLVALGEFEVYASVVHKGRPSPYASGRTIPLPAPSQDAQHIRRLSREQWGQSLDAVEQDLARLISESPTDLGPTGRRRRST